MSTRIPVTYVGGAAASGIYAAPGPVIGYQSATGNTLIALGYVVAGTPGALSATAGITSVTDTAGNLWQFSPADSQFPPSAYNPAGNGYVVFVAYCINAAAVTSVSFGDSTGSADTWNIAVAEFTHISNPVYYSAVSVPAGVSSAVTATIRAHTVYDVMVAAVYSAGAAISGVSAGDMAFALEGSLTIPPYAYIIGQNEVCGPSGPVYVIVGSASAAVTSAGSVTVTAPVNMATGDLVIFDVLVTGAAVTAWPAGFMQQASVTGANNPGNIRQVATKLASCISDTSYTASFTGTAATATALVYVLRGAASAAAANSSVLNSGGYTETLAAPALTIANPADMIVYGYGGCLGDVSGSVTITSWPAVLSGNSPAMVSLPGMNGSVQGIGWGVDAVPGPASASGEIDVLDYALDIPVSASGACATWTWDLSSAADSAMALIAFTPHCVEDTMPPPPMMRSFP